MGSREVGFREVNDAIRGLAAADTGEEIWEFFCECDDLACRALIRLTLREFDDRRCAEPPRPILAGQHCRGAPVRTARA
jgi:hypothetical protein